MVHISLDRLEIRDFKGIGHLEINFQRRDARISGRNESGKSTVYDALLWLLFGRDSRNAANFDVKPLDGNARPITGREPNVIATLDIDGAKRVLQRAMLEVWTTPKGQAEKVYESDRGAFWIDDVPKSKGEYEKFVSSLLPEAQFRLITNYEEFMLKNTREMRLVLLNIADQGVDAIMAERFPDVVAALDGLSADDARKKFKTQKAKFEEELAGIPSGIKELEKIATGANESDRLRLSGEVDRLNAEITAINVQLAQDPKAALRADLKRADREIADVEAAAKIAHDGAQSAAKRRVTAADSDVAKARRTVEQIESALTQQRAQLDETTATIEKLRADYKAVYESKFVPPDIAEVCPTCGQSLPAEQVADAMTKALNLFSEGKKKRAEAITSEGKGYSATKDRVTDQISLNETDLVTATAALESGTKELTDARNALADLEIAGVTYPPELETLRASRDAIQKQLDAPEAEQVKALRDHLAALNESLSTAQQAVAKCDVVKTAKARIIELEARQRELGDKAVDLNQRLFMVEQYVRERCHLLEESINARFITVRWRLFEELKGEGFKDVCTCLIPNNAGALVPYASANTGARVNAGMEIINVLSDAYQVAAPVFVENAESVDIITPTIGQQIALYKPDPEVCDWDGLKVEFSGR